MRRARAAALAPGASSSARIFHAALGTGQHHDGATYVIAVEVPRHAGHGERYADPVPGTQPAGRRVPARGPAGVLRSGLGTPSDRHSAPATAPVAPTGESGDTAGAATSSPRRSPSTSECPGTGDPGTPRAHASLVHRTAQTGEASRRIVSAQAGPSDSRSRLIKKRRTRRYARPVANQAPSHPRVPNGGSLRGRAKTQVALRDGLPRQPPSSAGRVHGCRLTSGMAKVSRRARGARPCPRHASEFLA
jgi:hypothetical protein